MVLIPSGGKVARCTLSMYACEYNVDIILHALTILLVGQHMVLGSQHSYSVSRLNLSVVKHACI